RRGRRAGLARGPGRPADPLQLAAQRLGPGRAEPPPRCPEHGAGPPRRDPYAVHVFRVEVEADSRVVPQDLLVLPAEQLADESDRLLRWLVAVRAQVARDDLDAFLPVLAADEQLCG